MVLGLLLLLLVGPWGPALLVAVLLVPRVRARLPRLADGRGLRGLGALGAVAVLVTGAYVVVPPGTLPVPPGAGLLVVPGYEGRPARAVAVPRPPVEVDTFAALPGPAGDVPEVDTAWFGLERCGAVVVDREGRLVVRCTGGLGRPGDRVRLLSRDGLDPRAAIELPGPDPEAGPRPERCSTPPPLRAVAGGVVLPTDDRFLQRLTTADDRGEASLSVAAELDLSPALPADDCVVDVRPADVEGVPTWWVSASGRVGTTRWPLGADGESGPGLDLDAPVDELLAVDGPRAVVATRDALVGLEAGPGAPQEVWRVEASPRTAPVLLQGGLVAAVVREEGGLAVVVHRADDGAPVCRALVLEEGADDPTTDLVPIGTGVVLTTPDAVRVDVPDAALEEGDRDCTTAWTTELDVAAAGPVLSAATGTLHLVTERVDLRLVRASYLTALDPATGERTWAVRTGTGWWADADGGAVVLGPDAVAYVAVRGGLVRVRDRLR